MDGLTNGRVSRAVLFDHNGREITGNEAEDRTDGMDLPHILTFASMYRGAAYTYNHLWDEGLRHARQNAMAMRRDAWLMALLRERADETLSKPWHLTVDNPRDKWQKTVASGITKIIQGIHRFLRLRRYLLQGALWYGRYGANVKWVWKEMYLPLMQSKGGGLGQPTAAPTMAKGKVLTIAKHKPVNGDKIGHHNDDTPYVLINSSWNDKIIGDRQIIYPNNAGGPALLLRGSWRDQIIIHTSDPDDGDYFDAEMAEGIHGVGARSRIYWLDFLRRDYFGAVTEMLNRIGLGLVVIYYDASNDKAHTEALSLAKNFSRRSVIVMPRTNDGVSQAGGVEVVETPMAGASIMLELQKHVEEQIERYMIGQLISGGGGTSNPLEGTGRAEFAKDTKTQLCIADAGDFDETMTGSDEEPGFVSIIKKWTYSYADFPVRYTTDHDTERADKKLEAVKSFVDMGGEVPTEPVRELIGIRAVEEGEDTLGGKEQMMQLKQMEADAKGQPFGGEGGGEKPPKSPHGDDDWHEEMKKTVGTEKYADENFELYAYDPSEPRLPAGDSGGGQWTASGKRNRFAGHTDKTIAAVVTQKHPQSNNDIDWSKLGDDERKAVVESMARWPKRHLSWVAERTAKYLVQIQQHIDYLKNLGYGGTDDKSTLLTDSMRTQKATEAMAKMLSEAGAEIHYGEEDLFGDKPFEPNPAVDGGHWVTMGNNNAHVYIVEGRIRIGHHSLIGKRIDALKEHGTGNPDTQRIWHMHAKNAGVDPKHMHQLTADFLAHDREYMADMVKMVKDAQYKAKHLHVWGKHSGYDIRAAVRNAANKGNDHTKIPGFDLVSESVAKEHPEIFAGHDDPAERLFELLSHRIEPMTEDDAYRQALDHLHSRKAAQPRQPQLGEDDLGDAGDEQPEAEAVPFASEEPVIPYGATESFDVHGLLERIRKMGAEASGSQGLIAGLLQLLRRQPHLRRNLSSRDASFLQALSMHGTEAYSAIFEADNEPQSPQSRAGRSQEGEDAARRRS